MSSDYFNRLQDRVDCILQQDELTFQELVRKCKGAYPVDILRILESQKYWSMEKAICMYKYYDVDYEKELITENIDNNPVLCSWYFSVPTCKKVVDLYSWDNKTILFLGMPRLFEYFIKHVTNVYLVLVDLDYYVINKLKEKYGGNSNCRIIHANLNTLEFNLKEKYDFIFLDPPWYLEYYEIWTMQSYKLMQENDGTIIFPLFQELTRPNAKSERKYLLNNIKECAEKYSIIPDYIEYEIPTFEKRQLQNCGIELKSPWRKADLVVAKGISKYVQIASKREKDYDIDNWVEVDIFSLRLFINTNKNNEYENVSIRYLSDNSSYLSSPSKRNMQLQLVNMLTSRGQGYIVYAAEKLIPILNEIKKNIENGENIKMALDLVCIDNLSKQILFEMLDN